MKPAPFEYHAPRSVEDAVAILAEVAAEGGRVLAGGQSLAPAMAFRLARPAHLVDINRIDGLGRIAVGSAALTIGATARHAAFHAPVAAGPLGALLSAVVRHIAHYPIRVRGTFCGSLAHADPASEWCLVAATLDAEIAARSAAGPRRIPAGAFFEWAMTTALADDELVVAADLPLLPDDARWGFCEFSRRAGDYALAMALAVYRLRDGAMDEPRIGLGGVEARPRRLAAAEAELRGRPPGAAAFAAAAEAAAAHADPMEDNQAGAVYRRELAEVMVRRALERAAR